MHIYLLLIISLFLNFTLSATIWQQEIHYDWQKINLDDTTFWQNLNFSQDFQWGVATSAFQIEGTQTHNGHVKNNWSEDHTFGDRFKNFSACGHWDLYKQDVQLIKNLGVNSYRFSIPWEKIEPQEGLFDQVALQHYKNLCIELKKNGIEPWICLFHFTFPAWFAQKNGFEKTEHMHYFLRFCSYIFNNFHELVTFWITYNEPVAYVAEAYMTGKIPPHKTATLKGEGIFLAGHVLKNMLNAHVLFYQAAKKIDQNAQIGIVKMFLPLDPYSLYNPIEKFATRAGNYLVHDSVLNFFKTGKFDWIKLVSDQNNDAPACLDFIGVNYYRNEFLQCGPFKFKNHQYRQGDIITPDNQWSIYPEGLYRSIAKASELKIPIYISENGIADSTDLMRNEFIKKHLYVIKKAIADGYNIKGYTYWSLLDNLEWIEGYKHKFGLYEVNFNTQERILRKSALPFIQFLHNQQSYEGKH